jgi:hypothetical protein
MVVIRRITVRLNYLPLQTASKAITLYLHAGLKTSAGKIYFGSINGFNSFYPYRIKPNVYMPPVMITRLDISNKEVTYLKTAL